MHIKAILPISLLEGSGMATRQPGKPDQQQMQSFQIKLTQENYLKIQLYAAQVGENYQTVAGDLLGDLLDSKYNPTDRRSPRSMEERIQHLESMMERLLAIPSVRKAMKLDTPEQAEETNTEDEADAAVQDNDVE